MLSRTSARFHFISCIMIAGFVAPAAAQNATPELQMPSRIVAAIDDSVRTTIRRSKHPLAKPGLDIGPLQGSTMLHRMLLILGAGPEQEQKVQTFLDSQQTKGSPDYHHWLTPEEFGHKFGPSVDDMRQVTDWLRQHGFTVGGVAKSGRWIGILRHVIPGGNGVSDPNAAVHDCREPACC